MLISNSGDGKLELASPRESDEPINQALKAESLDLELIPQSISTGRETLDSSMGTHDHSLEIEEVEKSFPKESHEFPSVYNTCPGR